MGARRIAILLIGAFSIGALSLARAGRLVPTARASALPWYDTRDFTPRWSPVNHRVAAFRLVDQQNRPITEKDIDGKIHIASFLFTQCPSLCPTLVQRLKPVQEALRGRTDVEMLSFSVTPRTDTPEVLADFGARRGIDPARWRLLTGDLGEISRVLRDSYFADDDRPLEGGPPGRLLHTEKVLLVDRSRQLRGIYNGTNAFEMQRLVEDIDTLTREN